MSTSVQSTPGLEIPGAFPRELYPEHTPTTRQPETRRASDLPQQSISLPSTEKEGIHPGEHYGGVGPLPGTISETSVAKLPDERANERKAASSAPASRSKEITADDPDEAVAAPVPSEGEAASESESKGPAVDTVRGYDVDEGGATAVAPVPDEQAPSEEKKATSESASGSKGVFTEGLFADTDRGDDARENVAAPVPASSEAPADVTNQDTSPVQRTDPQGPDAVGVGEQVPAEPRAADTKKESAEAPADSKFKEELRREEKNRGVFDKKEPGSPPPSRAAALEDPAPPKGGNEDPNKTTAVQPPPPPQQQQQQQPEFPGPRKGRSSSDSEPSNVAKASIMNRVKGEMKVLLGKASGNRDKVEEGERLKQGAQ